jgi:hypothetical protein
LPLPVTFGPGSSCVAHAEGQDELCETHLSALSVAVTGDNFKFLLQVFKFGANHIFLVVPGLSFANLEFSTKSELCLTQAIICFGVLKTIQFPFQSWTPRTDWTLMYSYLFVIFLSFTLRPGIQSQASLHSRPSSAWECADQARGEPCVASGGNTWVL